MPEDKQPTDADVAETDVAQVEEKAKTAASDGASKEDSKQSEASDGDQPEQGSLEQEVAELKDKLLRSVAEMENVRRRAQRDVENAHKFAIEKLINDLFPVIDSLEKAVETAEATEGAGAIAEGVKLSLKLFADTLGRSGVEQIDPLGEPFDPQVHEAMTMVPNPQAEPNSVMDVMQKGYLLNGRVVRAAKVIVAKAPDEQQEK